MTQAFDVGFAFAEKHMPDVKSALGNLPAKFFFDIQTASPQKDMTQATDLILSATSTGDIAVRVRRRKHYEYAITHNNSFDWSVRFQNKGYKTEIHKLREGFARWYFMGWSLDDAGKLGRWYLLDCDKIRAAGILERHWTVRQNGDGTSGMYIPIIALKNEGCVMEAK